MLSIRTPLVYAAVSGVCALLHTCNLIAADRFRIPMGAAVLGSFAIVTCVAYVLHSLFTFQQSFALLSFVRYVGAMIANIPLAYATVWIWHIAIGLRMPIAAPIATVSLFGLNFVLGKRAIGTPKNSLSELRQDDAC